MKKIIIILIILMLVSLVIWYGAGPIVVTKATNSMLLRLASQGGGYGLNIIDYGFSDARLSSLKTIDWEGLRFVIRLDSIKADTPEGIFLLSLDRVKVSIVSRGLASLEAWNFRLASLREESSGANESISQDSPEAKTVIGDYFFIVFPFKIQRPFEGISQVLTEVKGFAGTGRTSIPVGFQGSIAFSMGGAQFRNRLQIENRGKENVLVMNRDDIRKMAPVFDEKVVTDSDIDIISEHPLIAVKLLHIKNKARMTAQTAFQTDSTVPEDAYRHVLWSFLLTQEFGEQFAKTITDAHEAGLTGNTEAERRMDYNNNEVGRNYALRGIEESALLNLVMTDPAVVRSP